MSPAAVELEHQLPMSQTVIPGPWPEKQTSIHLSPGMLRLTSTLCVLTLTRRHLAPANQVEYQLSIDWLRGAFSPAIMGVNVPTSIFHTRTLRMVGVECRGFYSCPTVQQRDISKRGCGPAARRF